MHLEGNTFDVKAGDNIWIPKNAVHNIKSTSKYIILRYYFPKGPIEIIPYAWLSSRM